MLVWEEKIDEFGEKHKHIGFYIGNKRAVSNSRDRTPQKHHYTYEENADLPTRKIMAVFWKKDLERV